MFNVVNLTKGKQGVSIVGSSDGVVAILATAVAIPGVLEYGAVYTFYQLKDAEDIGITADYDNINHVRLHRHISEIYRMGKSGTKLYLSIAAQTVTMTDLIDITGTYSKFDSAKYWRY